MNDDPVIAVRLAALEAAAGLIRRGAVPRSVVVRLHKDESAWREFAPVVFPVMRETMETVYRRFGSKVMEAVGSPTVCRAYEEGFRMGGLLK